MLKAREAFDWVRTGPPTVARLWAVSDGSLSLWAWTYGLATGYSRTTKICGLARSRGVKNVTSSRAIPVTQNAQKLGE